jgi:glycosyltransferase involved in cell wall biosynthesis
MLASIQREVPFELAVVSNTKPTIPQTSLRWHFIPWSEETEISSLHSFDIGIMPLLDNEFQRGKCGMKLLQYMAVGIPTIASPVGVNRDIILHGETGFLASGEDEWRNALETLVRDAELRRQMGINGRQRCEELYSLKRWGPVLLDVFERVAGG